MRLILCNVPTLTTLSAKVLPPAAMRYTTEWSPDPITLRILISDSEYSNSRGTSQQPRKARGVALDLVNGSRSWTLLSWG